MQKKRLHEYSNVDYLASPAEAIATTKKFDGIYVNGSMHHFTDYVESIVDMKRHLKENGIVVICEPNVWNPINFLKVMNDYTIELGQFNVTRKNITKSLIAQNFEILSCRVLHYRGEGDLFRTLYPYKGLEKLPILNSLSIMFLIVARVKNKS